VRIKTTVVLFLSSLPLPCRSGVCGHATASLSVAIGVCVTGHPQVASGHSGPFAPELCITAKTLCFMIVLMATSLYGSTLYNVAIPASM